MPGGQPSTFDPKILPQVTRLCLLGLTDEQLAASLNVHVSTIYKWKNDFPEFSEAVRAGKEDADGKVAASLYQRALGYSHPDEKIFNDAGTPLVVPTTKHYPPDTGAAFIWLKNRRSGKWSDKTQVEHSGSVTIEQALDQAMIEDGQ